MHSKYKWSKQEVDLTRVEMDSKPDHSYNIME